LVRLVLTIFVFSLAASFASGGAHSAVGLSSVSDDGSIAMFLIGLVAIVVFVISGVLSARFDLVRLYYPLILLASISLLVIPVTGGHLEGHGLLPTVVYNVFIMFIWVLLSHVSDRTQLSAVQVFGWGRGASALGTTAGNVLAMEIQTGSSDPTNMMVVASVALLFALAATAMVVLKEGALDDMFAKTGGDNAQGFSALLDPFAQDAALAGKGSWMRSCEELADAANLSKREREVLVLLSKGRTIEFIAEDLGISFNTSKSHVRHVYEKTGVHTRQELLSLIETRRNAMRG
jgi:DNA-binding CsgD family transcriptional regulator